MRTTLILAVLITAFSINAKDLNILFIGNSYTGQVKGKINALLKQSPYKNSQHDYITPGGMTLTRHLANQKVIDKIKSKKWDYVVLQEQSQTPSLPGLKDQFQKAAAELCKIIKENGSTPVFYMTWGRRDGDKKNKQINPDYKTMQKHLTDSYTKAASTNKARLLKVGLIWSASRDKLKDKYGVLYKNDGSHPSANGAFLVACTIFKTLYKSDLSFIKPSNDYEKIIKQVCLAHK